MFSLDRLRDGQAEAIDNALIAAFRANPGSCLTLTNASEADPTRLQEFTAIHKRFASVHSLLCLTNAPEAVPSEVPSEA